MQILLTNDDGIYAKGIQALYKRLISGHAVCVIAPDGEQSAVGHAITLHDALRVKQVWMDKHSRGYAITGTPVDCIKIGLLELIDEKPDIVISGINPGANTGVNINYSGTVAAAIEAALYGVPAISVSLPGQKPDNYDTAAAFALRLAEKVEKKGLPAGTVLNVNVPDLPEKDIAGVMISRQSTIFFPEFIEKRVDPRDRTYYWYGCRMLTEFEDNDLDEAVLQDKYISITPLKCDMTDYSLMNELRNWEF